MSLEPSKHSLNFTSVAVGEASSPLISAEYSQRTAPVLSELSDLQTRLHRLIAFIDSELFDTLPKAGQGRLQRQKLIMIDYVAVLNERVDAW